LEKEREREKWKGQTKLMQRRNLKDAMNEMCDHTVAKIREHVETLLRLDRDGKGELLKFEGVEMHTDYPRVILYAILHRLLKDFEPRNDTYKDLMNKVLSTFEIKKTLDTFEIPLDDKVTDYKTQKEIAKKTLDESLKKK
jgi:hypothetical protein